MTWFSAPMVSFAVSILLLLTLRQVAPALGLIDRPGGRKTHKGDVPVIGGVAMFFGLLVATVTAGGLDREVVIVVALAGFLALLGALDDRFDLPARIRLVAHLSAAAALVFGVGSTVGSLGDLFGTGAVTLGPLSLPFTLLAVVSLINAFNMLDGLDGLAGGVGIVAFAAIACLATGHDMAAMMVIPGGMLGATAAFALFNVPVQFNRAVRTFMGDAGSTLLGFVLAGVSLEMIQPEHGEVSPVLLLWVMAIPVFELVTSTIRRLANGVPPTSADANHFHHILLRSGYSVRAIATLYVLSSAGCAAFAIWADRTGLADPVLLAAFLCAYLVWLLVVYRSAGIVPHLPGWCRRVDVHH